MPGLLYKYTYYELFNIIPSVTKIEELNTNTNSTSTNSNDHETIDSDERSAEELIRLKLKQEKLSALENKRLNIDEEWSLQPLPSLCGLVDMRRFFMITSSGYGQLAGNVSRSVRLSHTQEDERGGAQGGRKRRKAKRSMDAVQVEPIDLVASNQDEWKGSIILTPNDINELIYELLYSGNNLNV